MKGKEEEKGHFVLQLDEQALRDTNETVTAGTSVFTEVVLV